LYLVTSSCFVSDSLCSLSICENTISLMASMTASLHTAWISAPEYPSVMEASSWMDTSSSSGFLLVCIKKISPLASASGRPIRTHRSNRPGRSRATSMISGRLVAAMTMTLCMTSRPSSSVSICETTLSATCETLVPPLEGAMASISSKKTTQGAACLARRKVSRTALSLSPTHFEWNSGPLIDMKLALAPVATALARSVLPVPGGPHRRIPPGGSASIWVKSCGYRCGHSTDSLISCFASSRPPICSHDTSGDSTNTSLRTEGSHPRSAHLKSLKETEMVLSIFNGTASASRSVSGSTLLRALNAASLQRAERSAPTKPCVLSAMASRSTSSSRGMPLVWTLSISSLESRFGIPITISLSNRPGLRNAGSKALGRLVAPITTTFPRLTNPSIKASSCATTLLSTSPVTSSLLGAMESISSMKRIDGAFCWASVNILRSRSSLSP